MHKLDNHEHSYDNGFKVICINIIQQNNQKYKIKFQVQFIGA